MSALLFGTGTAQRDQARTMSNVHLECVTSGPSRVSIIEPQGYGPGQVYFRKRKVEFECGLGLAPLVHRVGESSPNLIASSLSTTVT
jgi:hypothetical protein